MNEEECAIYANCNLIGFGRYHLRSTFGGAVEHRHSCGEWTLLADLCKVVLLDRRKRLEDLTFYAPMYDAYS